MTESQSKPSSPVSANLPIQGGAAIVAPVGAFKGALPQNALVVIPVKEPTAELNKKLESGALVVTPEQMWELLGFNGPAVQVQDSEGRPLTIGLNDLLACLEKHWKEQPSDLNRGRMYAQELMKHGRAEEATKVLAKVVAGGGSGEDWLGLGVAQLGAKQWDKAESTLKGASNLLPGSPYPALHLAKVYAAKEDAEAERNMLDKAISIDPDCIDAWALLFGSVQRAQDEAAAVSTVRELADAEPNKNSAAPFIALQGLFAAQESKREQAYEFAKIGVERDADNPLALVALSSLLGHRGDIQGIIALLRPHESKMMTDVRLANNYLEALLQAREVEKATKLLNALATSKQREVKAFAIERSRMLAQLLQKQQAGLRSVGKAQTS
jgi:tetratricopeptide (TPR) repeat protein